MGNKSARDIISRLRRVNTLMEISDSNSVEESLFLLSQTKSFKALSVSVKSQLRRTVTLYYEYQSRQIGCLKQLKLPKEP